MLSRHSLKWCRSLLRILSSILMAVALSSELIQPFKFGAAVWATETTQARVPFFNVTMTPPGLQAFLYSSRLPACGPWNL